MIAWIKKNIDFKIIFTCVTFIFGIYGSVIVNKYEHKITLLDYRNDLNNLQNKSIELENHLEELKKEIKELKSDIKVELKEKVDK